MSLGLWMCFSFQLFSLKNLRWKVYLEMCGGNSTVHKWSTEFSIVRVPDYFVRNIYEKCKFTDRLSCCNANVPAP